jgi:hypothetical protein
MMQQHAAATEMARRLWASSASNADAPEEVAAAADRICTELRAGLGPWVGVTGYRALLDRALGLARADHPALGGLSCHGEDAPLINQAIREHGVGPVAAGLVALIAELVKVLGRIIGEEMALRLVEQTVIPTPREVVSSESKEGNNG